jgi:hypothetical protein
MSNYADTQNLCPSNMEPYLAALRARDQVEMSALLIDYARRGEENRRMFNHGMKLAAHADYLTGQAEGWYFISKLCVFVIFCLLCVIAWQNIG